MEVNDSLGNLYRAALMIGRGNIKMGELLLTKIGNLSGVEKEKNNRLWAEKILDKYYQLRWGRIGNG